MRISKIQRFSIDDGPGIRTTVFLSGCNLNCIWCHNPETISRKPRLAYYPDKCIHCGLCAGVCTFHAHKTGENGHLFVRTQCTACMRCIPVCPAGALESSSYEIILTELMEELMQDHPFYADGGVTFSGGEPMLQKAELLKAVQLCKQEGIHVAIDTAAHVPGEWFQPFYPYVDLFLLDCKAVTDAIHIEGTGVSNRMIMKNIASVTQSSKAVWIRIPVIPGINADHAEMEKIADFLSNLSVEKIELLPYHAMGAGKYHAFDIQNRMKGTKAPGKKEMDAFLQLFLCRGLPASHTAL